MAKGRMIDSGTFEDEWFGGLSLFDRLVWIGLITACADDQGRILNNPAIIRSHIFPYEDIKLECINNSLTQFSSDKKILFYNGDGKMLLQIVNWWEYQKPSWASPSKYAAPDGWIDRIKIHIPGNKVHTENWDEPGGFVAASTSVRTGVHTSLHIPIEKGEVKRREEVGTGGIFSLYENCIGLIPGNLVDELKQAEKDYPVEWQKEAFKIAAARNKRSWGYVRGIIRSFANNGFNPDMPLDGDTHPPGYVWYEKAGEWRDPRNIPSEEL